MPVRDDMHCFADKYKSVDVIASPRDQTEQIGASKLGYTC